jgi:hypothetical protein
MATQKTFSRGIAVLILLALIGYAYFEARPYLSGPYLVVSEPTDGFFVTESPVLVSGTAQRISAITLNGNPIFVDEKGSFTQIVSLSPGYGVIEVSVKDRYERTRTVLLHGTYTPNETTPEPGTATSTESGLDEATTTNAL